MIDINYQAYKLRGEGHPVLWGVANQLEDIAGDMPYTMDRLLINDNWRQIGEIIGELSVKDHVVQRKGQSTLSPSFEDMKPYFNPGKGKFIVPPIQFFRDVEEVPEKVLVPAGDSYIVICIYNNTSTNLEYEYTYKKDSNGNWAFTHSEEDLKKAADLISTGIALSSREMEFLYEVPF